LTKDIDEDDHEEGKKWKKKREKPARRTPDFHTLEQHRKTHSADSRPTRPIRPNRSARQKHDATFVTASLPVIARIHE